MFPVLNLCVMSGFKERQVLLATHRNMQRGQKKSNPVHVT